MYCKALYNELFLIECTIIIDRVAVRNEFSFPFPSHSHRIPTYGNYDFPQDSHMWE